MRSKICRQVLSASVFLLLLAAACTAAPPQAVPSEAIETAAPGATTSTSRPIPLIVDTDMGADDLMAILYLSQRPDVAVKAVTVSGTGLTHCRPGTRNALALLARVGARDVPVACGSERPLQGDAHFPPEWRAASDAMFGLRLPDAGQPAAPAAEDLLVSTIRSASEPVTLVTLGPLTNIAQALESDPALAKNIKMIYAMGGAIYVDGNVMSVPLSAPNTSAEFNMFVDSHAASLVLQSGAPMTLVPLDATNKVPINRYIYRALKAHHDNPAAQVLYDLFTGAPSLYGGGKYFWDPLTAAIAVDPGLGQLETLRLKIIEEDGPELGRTVPTDDGVPVKVALSADDQRFEDEFLSRLNGGAAVTIERTPVLPPAKLAVSQVGDKCTLQGPKVMPAGETGIQWTVDNSRERYGLAVVTLDEGKTFADLDAWPSTDPPPWLQLVAYQDVAPGTRSTLVADLQKGSIYLVCFTAQPVAKVETLGPIEVR